MLRIPISIQIFLLIGLCVGQVTCSEYGNYSGDILLAAFFPVHGHVRDSYSKDTPCGTVQEEDGIQVGVGGCEGWWV